MKTTTLILLLLYFLPTHASTEKKVGLAFNITDTRKTKGTFHDEVDVSFTRIADGQTVLNRSCYGFRNDVVDSLPAGTYTMIYNNIFGQELKRQVTIPLQDSFVVAFAVDSLQSYGTSAIDKLHDNEKIEINLDSHGCFHHFVGQIVIVRRKGKLIASATHFTEDPLIPSSRKKKGKLAQSVTLDSKMIAAYSRFENELSVLNTSRFACTTHATYKVSTPNLHLTKADTGCFWDGYFFLESAIFGELK